MEDLNYRRTLQAFELSNRLLEEVKKTRQAHQAQEDFQKTLERLWLSMSNEKPS